MKISDKNNFAEKNVKSFNDTEDGKTLINNNIDSKYNCALKTDDSSGNKDSANSFMPKIKLIADLHTHSVASTHAYATITEMAKAAADNGLVALAITDHARTMPGAPGAYYFENLSAVPDYLYSVRILKGIEANICDYNGNIDVDKFLQKKLDWIVASLHLVTINGEATVENCTQTYLSLAKNPYVNVIGHSGTVCFKYDYEKVIPQFGKNGKLVEINDSAFRYNKDSKHNCVKIAKLCKKYNTRIVVNTDSHFWTQVGRADNTLKMLEEIEFPKELIVNADIENLKQYFREKNILF